MVGLLGAVCAAAIGMASSLGTLAGAAAGLVPALSVADRARFAVKIAELQRHEVIEERKLLARLLDEGPKVPNRNRP